MTSKENEKGGQTAKKSDGREASDGQTAKKSDGREASDGQTAKKSDGREALDGYGYDLYPERKGQKKDPLSSMWSLFWGEGDRVDRVKCEKRVYTNVFNSPLVKLMMGALEKAGCPVDMRRHICCEYCEPKVSGGYDPILNQIVICQNIAKNDGFIQGILVHEMIHMYDYCVNKLDFKNVEHLACTEIRAANLTHCSFLSACTQGDASFIRIKQQHEVCVKNKALYSVLAVRNVTKEEAMKAINKVFDRCYNDLEPIGRRLKRNSNDSQKAYMEGHVYGYV